MLIGGVGVSGLSGGLRGGEIGGLVQQRSILVQFVVVIVWGFEIFVLFESVVGLNAFGFKLRRIQVEFSGNSQKSVGSECFELHLRGLTVKLGNRRSDHHSEFHSKHSR